MTPHKPPASGGFPFARMASAVRVSLRPVSNRVLTALCAFCLWGAIPILSRAFAPCRGTVGAVRPCSVWAAPLYSGGHPGPLPGFGQIPARFCGGFCVGFRTVPGGSLRVRLRVIVAAKVADSRQVFARKSLIVAKPCINPGKSLPSFRKLLNSR